MIKQFLYAASLLALASPAQATFISSSGDIDYIDFRFDGTVSSVGADEFQVRDQIDNETLLFKREDVPDYPIRHGDKITLAFRVQADQTKLSNPTCGGRFSIIKEGFGGQSGGACSLSGSAQLEHPGINPFFGNASNGNNGEGPTFIQGLDLVRDDAGEFSLAISGQGYSVGTVELTGVTFDSATNALGSSVPCGDAFRCPTDRIAGGADSFNISEIGIFGDFGNFRPGFNVSYTAGFWGPLSVTGGFTGISIFGSGLPTDVPAPAGFLLFGLGAGLMVWRRRKF